MNCVPFYEGIGRTSVLAPLGSSKPGVPAGVTVSLENRLRPRRRVDHPVLNDREFRVERKPYAVCRRPRASDLPR